MFSNLVSLINKSLNTTSSLTSVNKTSIQNQNLNYAKENVNPFLNTSFGSGYSYGKNQPVAGGYFAGYYNGKPNIVGRKLFIEV